MSGTLAELPTGTKKYGTVLIHKDRRLRVSIEEKESGGVVYTLEVLNKRDIPVTHTAYTSERRKK